MSQNEISDLFFHAILQVGSKTFSHFLNITERFLSLLRAMTATPETKIHLLKTVADFWRYSSLHTIIHFDKFITYRVVDCSSVISWVFSLEVLPLFTKGFIWEILNNTIQKTLARTVSISGQLKDLEKIRDRDLTDETNLEAVQKHKELYSTAQREQKELLVVTLQKFVTCIGDFLRVCESKGVEPFTENYLWYDSVLGHFRDFLRKYLREIRTIKETVEIVVFTSDIDQRIVTIWKQHELF